MNIKKIKVEDTVIRRDFLKDSALVTGEATGHIIVYQGFSTGDLNNRFGQGCL